MTRIGAFKVEALSSWKPRKDRWLPSALQPRSSESQIVKRTLRGHASDQSDSDDSDSESRTRIIRAQPEDRGSPALSPDTH